MCYTPRNVRIRLLAPASVRHAWRLVRQAANCQVPLSTAGLLVTLLMVTYLFVPGSRTCRTDLKLHPYVGATDVECTDPAFTIRCYESSVYQRAPDRSEVVCRTWRGRPVRIVDDAKRQRGDCQNALGWLAVYEPGRGCYCDLHSEERHGLCLPTDRWCRERFGTGAVAVISPAGDKFNCGCGTGYALGADDRHCEIAASDGPSAPPTLFPLRP